MSVSRKSVQRNGPALPIYGDTPERRVLNLAEVGLPEVPVLGSSHCGRLTAPGYVHQHPGCFEIGLCLRGALTLLSNGAEHRIMPGDLYLNKPGDRHCITENPKGTITQWIIIRAPQKGKPFLRLTLQESRDIWKQLSRLPCHVAAKTDAVKQAFAQLFRYYGQPPGTHRTVGLLSSCISLLIAVLDAAPQERALTRLRLIEQLAADIRDNPEREFRLDFLARKAGLSVPLVIAQFKQVTGLPPYHFQLSCRLEKAKRLLASTPASITQIAFDLGFCASQHFSSHFKRAFGLSPKIWRRQASDGQQERAGNGSVRAPTRNPAHAPVAITPA